MRPEVRRRASAPRDITTPEEVDAIERRHAEANMGEVADIDRPDVQEQTMRPPWATLLIREGYMVRLPTVFTIRDLLHRRVLEQCEQYARLLQVGISEIRADATLSQEYVDAHPGILEAAMLDPDIRAMVKRIIATCARPIFTQCANRTTSHRFGYELVYGETKCPECGELLLEGVVKVSDLEGMETPAVLFAGLFFVKKLGEAIEARKKKTPAAEGAAKA